MRAERIEDNTVPKKDTASVVLGMLSSAGAQTRPSIAPTDEPAALPPGEQPAPTQVTTVSADETQGSVSSLPTARTEKTPAEEAPRTLRLRAKTAVRLRNAWLEAKRDDVLLTAQDFASDLVEEALARHRRRRANSS